MWGRPDILWGLLALAIPVALHLLQLRRFKRVAFSNVAFLRDVQKETRSRHRLRNLLILLARLLAFGCLILAFADPMLTPESKAGEAGRNAVSIYVDTSPSMMASGESAPLLQEAKGKANALVESFAETDLFHVFTSGFQGQDQRFLTQPEALERIASIQLSSHSPGLEAVMERSMDQLGRAESASKRAFWISDVQESSHEVDAMTPPDTTVSWHLLPVQANPSPNLWVDSVWFETPLALPDREAELHVRIGHDALDGVDGLPLQLRVDGVPEALGSFNVVPGMPTDTVLRFTHGAPGPHLVEVRIDDAPVSFDDVHHIGYNVSSGVKALHWSGGALRDKTTQARMPMASRIMLVRPIPLVSAFLGPGVQPSRYGGPAGASDRPGAGWAGRPDRPPEWRVGPFRPAWDPLWMACTSHGKGRSMSRVLQGLR